MKKIVTIIAAVAVALTLMGCDMLGKGKTLGTKWKKTMTVDGTEITTTFRRFLKPLSTSRNVSAIKTTIAVDTEKSILKSDASGKERNAVVGLAFDFHKDTTAQAYDFVLLGFAPETKKFYIEKYEAVPYGKAVGAEEAMAEDKEDLGSSGFDTDDGSMADYKSFTGSFPMTLGNSQVDDDWKAAPAGSYKADGDNGYELYVQIKQATKGTYDIYLGTTKVGTYNGTVKDDDGYCVGGAAVYANTPKGTKVKVKYISDKDNTTGLFADEEEF